jgi:hypothetical protein
MRIVLSDFDAATVKQIVSPESQSLSYRVSTRLKEARIVPILCHSVDLQFYILMNVVSTGTASTS